MLSKVLSWVKLFWIVIIILLTGTINTFGQKESDNWYFGRNAGLNFDLGYPVPLTDGRTNTIEGVASVSNSEGELLFYSDGMTIWNSDHVELATGMSGDSTSTHAVTILPSRTDSLKYFVFTTSSINSLEDYNYGGNYYIVDFSSNSSGSVTEVTGAHGILENSTEKFAAIPYMKAVEDGPNIPAYRLLMHEFGNNTFAHFNLDETVSDYHEQTIGSWHLDSLGFPGTGANGQIKFSMQGDKVAVAMEGKRQFEVYDYDKETGVLSNDRFLPAGDSRGNKTKFVHMAHGVEFSPSGRFLYGSSRDGGWIYQWDLNIPQHHVMMASVTFIRNNPEINCGALQLAPNGKIYVALEGMDYLGVISSPNSLGLSCEYEDYGARLLDNESGKGGLSELGLPVAIPTGIQPEAFYYNHTCLGETTSFTVTNPTGLRYIFFAISRWDDGTLVENVTGDQDQNTGEYSYEHTFAEPGDYEVVLTAIKGRNTPVGFSRKVTIYDPPKSLWPQDTVLCEGKQIVLDAGNGAFHYWVESTARDRLLVIDSLGKNPITNDEYWRKPFRVFVTHYNGCLTKQLIDVERVLPPDPTYESTEAKCNVANGTATVIPNGAIENYIYRWKDFPGVTSNKITNIIGGNYGVFVGSIKTGCETYIEIPVNSQGAVRIIPSIDTLVCPGTEVTLTAENTDFYDWIIPEGFSDSVVVVKPEVTTTYRVRGVSTDPDGGVCETEFEYTVEVAPINKPNLGGDRAECAGDTIWVDGPEGYLDYTWNNSMTGRSIIVTEDINPLILYVKDTNQCVFSDEMAVTFHQQPDIKTNAEKALCGKLNGSASVIPEGNPIDYIFEWEDFPKNKTNKIFDVGAGLYRVKVTSILTGCDTLVEIAISEFGAPIIEITASIDEAICPGSEITLTAHNADYYIWDDPNFTREAQITIAPYKEITFTVMGATRDEEGNECKAYKEVTVQVLPYDRPDLGPDQDACEGDIVDLDGEAKYIDWNWSNEMTGQNINVTHSEPELVLTATDENQCPVTDTISIIFHPYPDVYLGEDRTLCTNEPIILTGGSGDSYKWSTNETSEQVSIFEKGTYWLEIEKAGCSARDSIILQLVNPDSIRIDSVVVKDISCFGETDGEIKVFAQGSGDTYAYSIDGGANYLDNSGHFDNLPAADTYLISVLEDSVCSKDYTQGMSIVEPTEIETNYRLTSPSCDGCMDGGINLTQVEGGSPPFLFLWDDLSTADKRLNIGTGNYSVNIADSRGCYTDLFFELDLKYRIPNAFTPNDDGINDLWKIGIIEYHPEAIVKVYDRKGLLVFESAQGYPEPWDGKYEGDFLPMGTYYYLIYLNDEDKPEKGTLTIVR